MSSSRWLAFAVASGFLAAARRSPRREAQGPSSILRGDNTVADDAGGESLTGTFAAI